MRSIEMIINVPIQIEIEMQEDENTEEAFHRAANSLQHWAKECTKSEGGGYPLVLLQSRVIDLG